SDAAIDHQAIERKELVSCILRREVGTDHHNEPATQGIAEAECEGNNQESGRVTCESKRE
ncbi:MAG: hypothetical protein RL529_1135, partial [Actinomycetota bacterium]